MPTFAEELRSLGKQRIGLTELRDAYLRAHPEALSAPEPRRLLLDALLTLEREGLADLPKRNWDTSATPALPRTASLRNVKGSHHARKAQAWLPMLGFAAEERHPVRRGHLQAINAFLVSARDRALCAWARHGNGHYTYSATRSGSTNSERAKPPCSKDAFRSTISAATRSRRRFRGRRQAGPLQDVRFSYWRTSIPTRASVGGTETQRCMSRSPTAVATHSGREPGISTI